MNGDKPSETARLCVQRTEFLRALLAFRRHSRRQPEGSIRLYCQTGTLHMKLGDLTVTMPARGDWPGPVLIARDFLHTVALLPPPGDPVAIRLENGFIQIGSTAMEYRRV